MKLLLNCNSSRIARLLCSLNIAFASLLFCVDISIAQNLARWKAHDMQRATPSVVSSNLVLPFSPPSDAIVLFDGVDLSKWRAADNSPSRWIVQDGCMESVTGAGYIYSRDSFGDIQLHVEWATPAKVEGGSQGRGNSGVFLMGLYEVQVLDSYGNHTYADGQAAAIYGQYPPLANASRGPGEWQSYDIFFRRPRFKRDGTVSKPALMTVLHNGVLVQDNEEIWGPTSWLQNHPYWSHPDQLPLAFQDHGNPVRYRNIWVRKLDEWTRPGPTSDDTKPLVTMSESVLEGYVGQYYGESENPFVITREGPQLFLRVLGVSKLDLLAHSKTEFTLRWTAGKIVFDLDDSQKPTAFTFYLGGQAIKTQKGSASAQ